MTKLRIAVLSAGVVLSASAAHGKDGDPGAWDSSAAAVYLDQRVERWSGWETAARERGTFFASAKAVLEGVHPGHGRVDA